MKTRRNAAGLDSPTLEFIEGVAIPQTKGRLGGGKRPQRLELRDQRDARTKAAKRQAQKLAGEVCKAGEERERAKKREAVAAARAAGNARLVEARGACLAAREKASALIGRAREELHARHAKELAELNASFPKPKPRSSLQDAGAKAGARKRSKKRAQSGKRTLQEEFEHEGANVPARWAWLWEREGKGFVRQARAHNLTHASKASASEMFLGYLSDNGVSDPDSNETGIWGEEIADRYDDPEPETEAQWRERQ